MVEINTTKLDDMKWDDVEVISKESEGNITVLHKNGETEQILTNLPEVEVGHRGKVLEIFGKRFFIREPYRGD